MPLKPDLRPTAHWREFLAELDKIELMPSAKLAARKAWERRQQIDADLVANHCPSHRLIGERMAKEIKETD